MSPSVEILPTPEALATRAADLFVTRAAEAITARGRFTVALAGGSTPERTYRLLAGTDHASQIDWARCHFFPGDERFVPVDDPRSNLGMARRSLLDHVAVPADNIHAVPTHLATVQEAAIVYGQTLTQAFGGAIIFDLLLLGLGDDGHTLSLFPGKPALTATNVVTWSPPGILPPPVDRVTLTFPTANACRHVVFLVSGAAKADIVPKVLADGVDPAVYPAAGIRPTSGTLTWLLDAAAGRDVTR